jgi:hypothetical protein
METVTNAASAAANTVNRAVFGTSATKDEENTNTNTRSNKYTSATSDSTAADLSSGISGGDKFRQSGHNSAMREGGVHPPAYGESLGHDRNTASGSKFTEMGAPTSTHSVDRDASKSSTNKNSNDEILADDATILDSSGSFSDIQNVPSYVGSNLSEHQNTGRTELGTDGYKNHGSSAVSSGFDTHRDNHPTSQYYSIHHPKGDGYNATDSDNYSSRNSSHKLATSVLPELASTDGPKGPTRTEVQVSSPSNKAPGAFSSNSHSRNEEDHSPFNDKTGKTSSNMHGAATSVTSGAQNAISGALGKDPASSVDPSVGATPFSNYNNNDNNNHNHNHHHNQTQQFTNEHSHQHTSQSKPSTYTGPQNKSIPLVDGHPESNGPKTVPGMKLPSVPGIGEATGTQHAKSTGLAAEGGNFDASAAGAATEAHRLQAKIPDKDHRETEHKHHYTNPESHEQQEEKPSIVHKIKDKILHHK